MVKMNHFAAPFLGFVRKLLHPTGLAAGLLLVTALSCCAAAEAQSAYFSGQAAGIGSGFNTPSGVAVDASGNVFVADPANNAVQEIVAAGGYVTVYTIGSGFSAPNAVAVDASGNVFVADTGLQTTGIEYGRVRGGHQAKAADAAGRSDGDHVIARV